MNESIIKIENEPTEQEIKVNAEEVILNGLEVGDINVGEEFGASITGNAPLQKLNLTFPNYYARKDEIPTKNSELENDSNFIYSETDPTVPNHVKDITEEQIQKWDNLIVPVYYFDGVLTSTTNKNLFKMLVEKYVEGKPFIVQNKEGMLSCGVKKDGSSYLFFFLGINSTGSNSGYGVSEYPIKKEAILINPNNDISSSSYLMRNYYAGIYALGETNRVLSINNTKSFTPTGNYNPTSKKYVDDAIAQAIANLNGGE